ncbi:MAG TPA: transglycosylase SLT domain-containing protein [Burkholderiales bacterium]|nr:transglycosylase SLT domain-containing protein [Burkholderiales bacterium]
MRIGKLASGPLKGFGREQLGQWPRKAVTVLVLLASVSAWLLILEAQYGQQWRASEATLASLTEPSATDEDPKPAPGATLTPAQESRYRALSEFVARRYRVSQGVAFDLVSHAHHVGGQLQLDPLLIIAVIAIESRFNPIAESGAGAKGLMQIIPKYHEDKLGEFGGEHAVFNPETNIEVGSQILREYIRRTGNLSVALQMYAGALGDHEDRYTRKVLNERQRLQQVLSGQNPPAPPAPVKTATVVRATSNSVVVPAELD